MFSAVCDRPLCTLVGLRYGVPPQAGDKEKAVKFLEKSLRMHPTPATEELLRKVRRFLLEGIGRLS